MIIRAGDQCWSRQSRSLQDRSGSGLILISHLWPRLSTNRPTRHQLRASCRSRRNRRSNRPRHRVVLERRPDRGRQGRPWRAASRCRGAHAGSRPGRRPPAWVGRPRTCRRKSGNGTRNGACSHDTVRGCPVATFRTTSSAPSTSRCRHRLHRLPPCRLRSRRPRSRRCLSRRCLSFAEPHRPPRPRRRSRRR